MKANTDHLSLNQKPKKNGKNGKKATTTHMVKELSPKTNFADSKNGLPLDHKKTKTLHYIPLSFPSIKKGLFSKLVGDLKILNRKLDDNVYYHSEAWIKWLILTVAIDTIFLLIGLH